MEVSKYGQVFYQAEAEALTAGCISRGNEHGACMDRGCEFCHVYYDGPDILLELRPCYLCGGTDGLLEWRELANVGPQVVHAACLLDEYAKRRRAASRVTFEE